MKTKLLYVLVSSDSDIYLEQAFVSMKSARFHMPDVHISLVMDNETVASIVGKREEMVKPADEIVSIDLPQHMSAQNRSRILKTSCRQYINGDFLFIDCDTVITRPLDEIDNINGPICACRDAHSSFTENPYRKMCVDHCERIGCDVAPESTYFNSGVMFVKDTALTRDFYRRWNENWIEGNKMGVSMDQPSLAKTNIEFARIIKPLPDVWNCQILHGIRYLAEAKILHYLCTNKGKDKEIFILRDRFILEDIKKHGLIPAEVEACYDNPFTGIPELVYLLSGKNVYVCRSDAFMFLSSIYDSLLYRLINGIVHRMCFVKQKLTNIIPVSIKKVVKK